MMMMIMIMIIGDGPMLAGPYRGLGGAVSRIPAIRQGLILILLILYNTNNNNNNNNDNDNDNNEINDKIDHKIKNKAAPTA